MAYRKDYSGQKFGRLTAIEFVEKKSNASFWRMSCECGTDIIIRINNAVSGSTKSCGCLKEESQKLISSKLNKFNQSQFGNFRSDITGQKFNKLTAIKPIGKAKQRCAIWEFRCDCGNKLNIESYRVVRGSKTNCGCVNFSLGRINIRTKYKIPKGKAAENNSYKKYKDSAKQRNIKFELTKEEAGILFRGNCFYCNEPPSIIVSHKNYNGDFIRNGIDRLDSEKHYTLENCVSCCSKCNYAKKSMSFDEFINWAAKLANHLFKIKACA